MNFNDLVNDLQGNPNLIADYVTNLSGVLSKYNLTVEETNALLSGDFEGLVNLGLSNELAAGVLSGAHSQRCGNIMTRY